MSGTIPNVPRGPLSVRPGAASVGTYLPTPKIADSS
jgi:hypothetical protein